MPHELHLALQEHYAGDDGVVEAQFGRYRIDVLRDGVAYEIQTRGFHRIRNKLEKLAEEMQVVVVWAVPDTKFIVRVDKETGEELSSRRSPKRGSVLEVFPEVRAIGHILARENVSLEVVKTVERELRHPTESKSRYRRREGMVGRELIEVVETTRFDKPRDYLSLLPANLPAQFTVADLSHAAGINRWLAGYMAASLHRVGATDRIGKQGNAYVYEAIEPQSKPAGPERGAWLEVRCSTCGLLAFEARKRSVVRWRCGGCQALETWRGK